jgi:hypothetical protein
MAIGAFAAVSLGVSALGVGTSIWASVSAADAAKDAAKAQKARNRAQIELEKFDLIRDARTLRSRLVVQAARGGFEIQGTPLALLREVEADLNEGMERLETNGRIRDDIIEADRNTAVAASTAQIIGTATRAAGLIADAGAAGAFALPPSSGTSGTIDFNDPLLEQNILPADNSFGTQFA